MKDWLSLSEIAQLQLPGFPKTKRGMAKYADAAGWSTFPNMRRHRKGAFGGGGYEYHSSLIGLEQTIAKIVARDIALELHAGEADVLVFLNRQQMAALNRIAAKSGRAVSDTLSTLISRSIDLVEGAT